MEQPSLLDWRPPPSHRFGQTYDSALDEARLNAQQLRVWHVVSSGKWLALYEIAAVTNDPEASISARLRDFRNMFSCKVERRRRGEMERGLYEYRVTR